ncbi:hypothetical protein KC140_13990 [Listeria monocytogenes]|uniref:hypothetical protein n=1 Tax=Listeria monocytogenes TaxID=1639 RepID=UPI00074D6916|nr:hypothetical protein [Listeria monocytogenes]EJC5381657.1 hypothetical protein [Listeria monocytogenes]EKL6378586.1 hypothetical protein [Listeria monocytogenes]MBX9520255.1 hypothetical protein [Listeria monocytogenes]MBX9522795.1 hypothetical protein [Listeria monocytogenes]MBX9528193.1 hypothetical protein [Listeria monocytogenes]
MAQSKNITAYIPVNITIEIGELTTNEEVSAEQLARNITPNFIPYEDKMYVKVDREPRVDDVVIINKMDGRVGSWVRRVAELAKDLDNDFFFNIAIDEYFYFDSWEDEYLAVYEPVKESGEHD